MAVTMLRAGVARETISPPPGIYQIGFGDRSKGNKGVHDDLTATALVLEAGEARLALVACDLLCLNEYMVDRIRVLTEAQAPPIIACSHTHSGPIAYADDGARRENQAYITELMTHIASAVERAAAAMVPAELTWAEGEAATAVNRRQRQEDGTVVIGVNPAGVVDRSLALLGVRAASGEPLATVINYACHGTVLGPENLLVSADWIGPMRAHVEGALGGLAIFLQGAAGNLNPRENVQPPAEGWVKAQTLGEEVGRAAVAAAAGATPLPGVPIALTRHDLWLPLQAAAVSDTPPDLYQRPLARAAGLPAWLTFLVDPLLARRYPWRSRIEARGGLWQVPMRLNAARIGDVAIVTFGAEVFAEIGLAVKATSPAAHTMFASVADGCIGYLPTAEAHDEGGYEVETAPFFYRYPTRLARTCTQVATDAASEALKGLWQE